MRLHRFTPIAAALIALAALTITSLAAAKPAHEKRGDEVEAKYRHYALRLRKAHEKLLSILKIEAPDLYKQINSAPPQPVEHGYQIVPKIIPNPAPDKEPRRAVSVGYSWPRTEQFIDWELPKIAELEEKLAIMPKIEAGDRRPVYQKMAADYPELEANQRTIDNHVQYNRFWQKVIAEDTARFDRLTRLHDFAVERQMLLDKLELGELERARLDYLTRQIRGQNDDVRPPPFVKVIRKDKSRRIVVEVPIHTDIHDKKFVAAFKQLVEAAWRTEDGGTSYEVRLRVIELNEKALYRATGAPPPAAGKRIDVSGHVERFPASGGVLTTGANSTYAIPGRYVALGPQDLTGNVIAHEFGHILGFVDGYFRGYRERGEDGFEVLEIVPDPDDIMSTPGTGKVRRHHFETLLSARSMTKK